MYDYLTRGLGLGQVTVLYYHIVPTLPSFVSYSMYAIQLQTSIILLCWGFRFAGYAAFLAVDIDISITDAPAHHVRLPARN
jgi:hypothetical protein